MHLAWGVRHASVEKQHFCGWSLGSIEHCMTPCGLFTGFLSVMMMLWGIEKQGKHRECWSATVCGIKSLGGSGQPGAISVPSYQDRSTGSDSIWSE